MKKINAVIVGDSISPKGDRITTMLMTFPRSILAELNTHRMFSRNSSSSRAIPFAKMVETVKNEPFIPIAWQKDHKGMQGVEYITDKQHVFECEQNWLIARTQAVQAADRMSGYGVTKQVCNRLLEPFMWHTALVTSTEWQNFFEQRCPEYPSTDSAKEHSFRSKKDWLAYHKGHVEGGSTFDDMFWLQLNKGQAEIHMMALAEAVWDAMNESAPKQLKAGEWHIPFSDKMTQPIMKREESEGSIVDWIPMKEIDGDWVTAWRIKEMVKISVAMCARTSYTTIGEEKEINYQNLIDIHDRMISAKPIHFSPFEHCARVMSEQEYNSYLKGYVEVVPNIDDEDEVDGEFFIRPDVLGWCDNLKGFIPYRHMIQFPNEF